MTSSASSRQDEDERQSHIDHQNNTSNRIKQETLTAKVKPELPYLFEKELTEKQNKRIYIVDEFVATERGIPIEGKFYARFRDKSTKEIAERQPHWQGCEERRRGSRMKQGYPVLESQVYGWMPKNISKMALKEINSVQAPKRRGSLTVYGEKLYCEKVTERPRFTGGRFYLR